MSDIAQKLKVLKIYEHLENIAKVVKVQGLSEAFLINIFVSYFNNGKMKF